MDPVRNSGVQDYKIMVLLEKIIIKFRTGWMN